MEKFTDFDGLFLYFAFLLIVIFGLFKWIIDLLESIKELKKTNARLNYFNNFEAKEYLKLQKEFDEAIIENEKFKTLLETQDGIINDLSKTD